MTPEQAKTLGISYPQGVTIPSVDADIDACQKIATDQPDQRNQCFADLDKKLMEDGRPLGPVPVGQEHHGDGEHRDQVGVRPVLRLPVVHADGREQQRDGSFLING